MRLIFLYPLVGDGATAHASDGISLANLHEPIDAACFDKLTDRDFLSQYAKTADSSSSPSSSSSSSSSVSTARLEWFSSTKRLPVVAFVSTEPASYTVPLLNAALGLEAFSAQFVGLQMHVGNLAVFLHLSLPEPDAAVGTSLLLYVFSLAHVVCLWHPRSTFDVRWLRRLKRISRLQRSAVGQRASAQAKSFRSARLGPCRCTPLLASIFTCFDDQRAGAPLLPDAAAVQAQIYSLVTSSPIPCLLGAAAADVLALGSEPPPGASPAPLFALAPSSPVFFATPFAACFDFAATSAAAGAAQQLANFITAVIAPAATNRLLPTAKALFLGAVALHPIFFAAPPSSHHHFHHHHHQTGPLTLIAPTATHSSHAKHAPDAKPTSSGHKPSPPKQKGRGKKYGQHRAGGVAPTRSAVSVETS